METVLTFAVNNDDGQRQLAPRRKAPRSRARTWARPSGLPRKAWWRNKDRTRSRLARGPHFGLDAFCGRPPDCDGAGFPAVSHGHPGFHPHCNL